MPVVAFSPLGNPSDRRAYEWLASQESGGLLELPVFASVATPSTFHYQFGALLHRHPIVNGYSGHRSTLQDFLNGAGSPLFDANAADEALVGLRLIGVRYIAMHADMFTDAGQRERLLAWLDSRPERISQRQDFGTTTIWKIADVEEPRVDFARQLTAIPSAAFQVRASHASDRLRYLVDGDVDTRWLSGERQDGTEWIAVQLSEPRDVARARIDLAPRSLGDYPREVVVESVSPAGATRTLVRRRTLPLLFQGLVFDAYRAPIVLDFPPNESTVLRIRQLGTTRSFFWSIHELTMFAR
jgi:hypothetical protein